MRIHLTHSPGTCPGAPGIPGGGGGAIVPGSDGGGGGWGIPAMGGGGGGMGAEVGGAVGVFDGLTVVPATCKITLDTSHACTPVCPWETGTTLGKCAGVLQI